MKEIILKQVLKNALNFNGKVNSKVILGLVLRENSELKTNVPQVMKEIENVAKEISNYQHVSKVISLDNKNFEHAIAEKIDPVIVSLL